MASVLYDFGLTQQDDEKTEIPSFGKPSARGPTPVNRERGSVDIGPFTKIPNRFFSSGTAASLKPSATLLYVALCDHANRKGSNTFKASDKALASDTTLSPRTICNARKRLIEYKLITCTREEGQSYVYTLPVPAWNWVPVAKRGRSKLKPRAYHALKTAGPDGLEP